MKLKALEHWRGVLKILSMAAAPWGAFLSGQTTFLGALGLSVISAVGGAFMWVDESVTRMRTELAEKRAAKAERRASQTGAVGLLGDGRGIASSDPADTIPEVEQ